MSVRLDRTGLSASTDVYRKGDKSVVLIGVCHTADPAFWDEISDTIRRLERRDFHIQYEGVKAEDPEKPLLPLDHRLFATLTGLMYQKDGIDYQDHWERTDVTERDIAGHVHPEKLERMRERMERMRAYAEDEQALAIGRSRFFRTVMVLMIGAARMARSGIAGIPRHIIIDHRNAVAALALAEEPENVAGIWGAAHLPGIGRLLETRGYTRTNRIWNTAITWKKEAKHA